jgi:4-amino-4-deoxy-L-arabinose transferase-like glycosyltransferase
MRIRNRQYLALILLALAAWALFYRLGDFPLLDDPNEGQYAEVAREMVESGDWISPQLNYVLFLNKPALSYWAIASAFKVVGVNELGARLPSALSGLAIVGLTVWLGSLVFDSITGLLAGFILLAMGGFFVETHEVRPDLLLTAGITGALVAIAKLFGAHEREVGHCPLLGLQLSLAVGLLSKGMLGLIVPGVVGALLVLTERRWDLLRALRQPRAWWLLILLVAPWHLAMSFKHTGFAWDYIVNQHILFFFDRKFPRDSTPISLATFWLAFALRLFPWTLFAPLALAVAATRTRRDPARLGYRLVLAWAVVVLAFFSAAGSRMEHYSIPALPALALLLAKLFRDYASDTDAAWGSGLTGLVVVFALAALAGPTVVPGIVRGQEWLTPNAEIVDLARFVFGLLAGGAVVAAIAAVSGHRSWVVAAFVVSFAAVVPSFLFGMKLMAPGNSSAGMAEALRVTLTPQHHVVVDAPIEYQSSAGLSFYLRRRLELLSPAGFVPPSYLAPHLRTLFTERVTFERWWRDQPTVLIAEKSAGARALPQPHVVLTSDYARWAVVNRITPTPSPP